jgi:putative transposase
MDDVVPIRYFNGDEYIGITCGNLPHWHQAGVVTFVTFRLADALPEDFWVTWRAARAAWLTLNPPPHREAQRREYTRRFERPLNHRLDTGHGSMILGDPDLREIIAQALRYFDGDRLRLHEYVVATNHVHALLTPLGAHRLGEVIRSIKGWSGKQILGNERARGRLRAHQPGRDSPRVWQRESFDHLVRSEAELTAIRTYIRNHPTYVAP